MNQVQPLRPEDVARLRMKKASDDTCACYSVQVSYGRVQVRYCDKHRPTCAGTHGKSSRHV